MFKSFCFPVLYSLFFYLATHLLSRPSPVQQGVNKGILIGYTASGTPLYSFTSPQSVIALAKVFVRQVLAQTESRQIFYFLCLNLVRNLIERTVVMILKSTCAHYHGRMFILYISIVFSCSIQNGPEVILCLDFCLLIYVL